ncbi:hypothetical protein [Niallia sp. NCCP-28]|uniref:hypothetical protein n=1 Tax=Niallia sp. NCCP-28 TaxID=2934712 RepID=UPI0020824139|nr:hypothetical protein [Niallia sp. NCCP-28]GKU82357.1 hypothetical protein NCCP28_17530 [Niallia sp. NCCP-28]
MKKLLLNSIPVLFLFTACSHDIPDKDVKPQKESAIDRYSFSHAVQASAVALNEQEITVHHVVRGSSVFIECRLNSLSFRKNNPKKQAKLLLKVDGQLVSEHHSAAFVVRDLSAGEHKLVVEAVNANNKPYHLSKEFTVTIQ